MALLERIGLDRKAKEFPDRLSGGQPQRVAIVRNRVGEGMTIVMATHEMGFAREVSSKVCFLYGGVVRLGRPARADLRRARARSARAAS